MPTKLPQRRHVGLNFWHVTGMVIGFIAVTGIFWLAGRARAPELVTTGQPERQASDWSLLMKKHPAGGASEVVQRCGSCSGHLS